MAAKSDIFTIGYGRRTFDEFAALLKRYEIKCLIDTRSQPHSRWRPAYNRNALAQSLEREGITYVFLGDSLGGRPSDPSCYVAGRIDYSVVRTRDWFQAGIAELVGMWRGENRVAIMCAEQKPEQCHRTLLIGEELHARGLAVTHIDDNDEAHSHRAVMRRLLNDDASLFDPERN